MRWSLLLLLVPMAVAHGDAHGSELFIEAHDDDGWYFVVEGHDGKNPTLVMAPGETYTVVFVNQGSVAHDLHLGDFSTPLLSPGESHEMNVTVPQEGLGSYHCHPHAGLGMEGEILTAPAEESSPGFGMAALAAIAGVALYRRR